MEHLPTHYDAQMFHNQLPPPRGSNSATHKRKSAGLRRSYGGCLSPRSLCRGSGAFLSAQWSRCNRAASEAGLATHGASLATHEARPATHGARPATHEARPATHGARPATHEARPATHGARPATHEAWFAPYQQTRRPQQANGRGVLGLLRPLYPISQRCATL